jgi:hypothetical protein
MTHDVFETCGDLYLDLPSAKARAESWIANQSGSTSGLIWSDILVCDSGCTWRATRVSGVITFVVDVVQRFLR